MPDWVRRDVAQPADSDGGEPTRDLRHCDADVTFTNMPLTEYHSDASTRRFAGGTFSSNRLRLHRVIRTFAFHESPVERSSTVSIQR